MNTTNNINSGNQKVYPRMFTFKQLSRISDENFGVLNQCIDLSGFKPKNVFYLEPVMIHHHSNGELIEPHLRTIVYSFPQMDSISLQDLWFEQWKSGKIIQKDN